MNKKKSKRGNWLVTLPLAVLGVVYVYFFFLPAKKQIDQLRVELRNQQQAVANAEPLKLAIYHKEQELEAAEQYIKDWKVANPPDAATLLARISDQVDKAGVHTMQFDPRPTERLQSITKNTLTLGIEGSFHDIMAAIFRLESLEPTIWLDQIRIEAPTVAGKPLASEVNLVIFAVNPNISD